MMDLDFALVNQLIQDRYINCQRHPSADLRIFNYTVKTQFDRHWTSETMACRGLIVDGNDRVVARPFKKFFSYDQLNGVIPNEPFEVYEKLDGSLGVLYFVGDEPHIATRGSFISEQAQWATAILRQRYSQVKFDQKLTYLFEIIYPGNRVVVDYGGLDDLFLLAVIDTATGNDLELSDIGMPIVKRYDGINDVAQLLLMNEENKEGFVIKFQSGTRIKMKFEEYKRLHKLITGINARDIWEVLKDSKPLEPVLERVPDEFYNWVKKIEADLRNAYHEIETRSRAEFRDLGDRKQNAAYYQQCSYPAVLFKMLDGREYSEIIWKHIKPKGDLPFKCNFEEV